MKCLKTVYKFKIGDIVRCKEKELKGFRGFGDNGIIISFDKEYTISNFHGLPFSLLSLKEIDSVNKSCIYFQVSDFVNVSREMKIKRILKIC